LITKQNFSVNAGNEFVQSAAEGFNENFHLLHGVITEASNSANHTFMPAGKPGR
jgi:hypothetical protein